jgi:tRNA threonylcarbamoyladenosine biosynthesis protein TsaB
MSSDLTLALDGSTYAGSVAVIDGRKVIADRQLPDVPKPGRSGREELFMPMVAECLRDVEVETRGLARVVCGAGPGSFTSLRIAASIAKGIAVGNSLPLFAVSSLMLIVADAAPVAGRWMAALPAMRGEVFVAVFDVDDRGTVVEVVVPRIIAEERLAKEAASVDAQLLGPAVRKGENPHARGTARVLDSIIAGGPCDIAAWEPMYGRLAEAQVRWEAAHGRPLTAAG